MITHLSDTMYSNYVCGEKSHLIYSRNNEPSIMANYYDSRREIGSINPYNKILMYKEYLIFKYNLINYKMILNILLYKLRH